MAYRGKENFKNIKKIWERELGFFDPEDKMDEFKDK